MTTHGMPTQELEYTDVLQAAQGGPVADLPLERYTYVAGVQGRPSPLVPVPRSTCSVTYTPTSDSSRPDAIQSADFVGKRHWLRSHFLSTSNFGLSPTTPIRNNGEAYSQADFD